MDSWVPAPLCPSEATKQKPPVWLSPLLRGFRNSEINLRSNSHPLSVSEKQSTIWKGQSAWQAKRAKGKWRWSFSKQIIECLPLCMEGKKSLHVKAVRSLEQEGDWMHKALACTEALMPLIQSCVTGSSWELWFLLILPLIHSRCYRLLCTLLCPLAPQSPARPLSCVAF